MSDLPHPRNPIAANDDPETSHEAAREVTSSGERDRQAQLVLDHVRVWPGRTSAELSQGHELDRYVFARRLPELARLGFIKRGIARRCTATGRRAITWW